LSTPSLGEVLEELPIAIRGPRFGIVEALQQASALRFENRSLQAALDLRTKERDAALEMVRDLACEIEAGRRARERGVG
jgi:hypothetical protein